LKWLRVSGTGMTKQMDRRQAVAPKANEAESETNAVEASSGTPLAFGDGCRFERPRVACGDTWAGVFVAVGDARRHGRN
jgi:hypothetical protein